MVAAGLRTQSADPITPTTAGSSAMSAVVPREKQTWEDLGSLQPIHLARTSLAALACFDDLVSEFLSCARTSSNPFPSN